MKIKHLFIAILAVAALVSCNREELTGSSDGDKNYMGFSISMPGATKATKAANTGNTGDFVYGEQQENEIKTIHFFFYNDGRYVSSGFGDMKDNFTVNDGTENPIEKILDDGTAAHQGVVILESSMTEPNQVLCVINSRNPGFYKNKSLAAALAALHSGKAESVTGNDTDSHKDFYGAGPYFVMVTSPMYGYNAKGAWEIKQATDIVVDKDASGKFTQKSHIQSDRSSAKANPVEIYVERLAARSEIANLKAITEAPAAATDSFGIFKADVYGEGMREGGLATGDPIWDIKPLAWSLTAVNKQSFSLKHVDLAWRPVPTATQNTTFTNWIETTTEAKVTNPVYNYTYGTPQADAYKMFPRINWAYDPEYGNATERDIFPHSARELETKSAHKYYSATEIAANFAAANWADGDMLQRYSYENTFDPDGQKDPRITGTMLLLYVQAKKHKPVPPATSTSYEDLYNYMGQFQTYDEYAAQLLSIAFTGTKVYKLDGTDYKLLTKDDLQIVKASKFDDVYGRNQASYKDDKNKPSTVVTTPATELQELYSNYIIDLSSNVIIPGENNLTQLPQMDANKYYPVGDKSIEKSYSDGYVTLVPKATLYCNSPYAAKVNELYVENPAHATDPSAPEYIKATDAQIAEVFLGSVIDVANQYKNGLMYYAIPIEHFGKAMTEDTTPPTPGFVAQPLEGNYGIVRNNFYKVNIGKINGMGHGIHDVDEPIVPGDRKKPYYLAAKINILSWQIATQTADLAE